MNALIILMAVAVIFHSIVLAVVLLRALPLIRRLEDLVQSANGVVTRFDGAARHLEVAAGGVQEVERRIRSLAHVLLDEVEPTARRIAGVAAGVRTAFRTLMQGNHPPENGSPDTYDTNPIERRAVR